MYEFSQSLTSGGVIVWVDVGLEISLCELGVIEFTRTCAVLDSSGVFELSRAGAIFSCALKVIKHSGAGSIDIIVIKVI
jgi:hypothetical protein